MATIDDLAKGSENQPRDNHGRWASGGGGGPRGRTGSKAERQAAAVEASTTAHQASARATLSGAFADHRSASRAHEVAARAHVSAGLTAGNREIVADHNERAMHHSDEARRIDEKPKTDEELASIAHDAAFRVPESDRAHAGNRVFLSDVHAAMTPTERGHFGGSLGSFKSTMERLSRGMHVGLARADIPQVHVNNGNTEADRKASLDKVQASATHHSNSWVRHFLDISNVRAHKAVVSKYDPDEPRDDHGEWTTGGGGGASLKERAAASMTDPAFRAEHAERLARADYEARRNFPNDPHGSDANEAVSNWQHSEAGRILTEHDAHGGDADLKQAAEDGRIYARATRKTELTEQHEEAMRSIADRKPVLEQERAEQATRDAGAVPAIPATAQSAIDEHKALQAASSAKLEEIGSDLHEAHQRALLSLHELHGMASEDVADSLPSHDELAEHYGHTHEDLVGGGGHGYEEIGDHVASRDPVEPPEGIELNEETGKPEPWTPSTSGYTKEHEDTLSIDEDTGKADPWSHDLFHESLSGDAYPHLEYDEHGAPLPWGPSSDAQGHRAAYESEAEGYRQAAANHKAEYERIAADYERHRAADKADYTAKVEQYKQAVAARDRETQAKAEETQAHLEALHEKQVAALSSLSVIDKAEGKSSAKAHKELDKIGDDEIHEHVSSTPPFAGKTRSDDGRFHDAEAERLHRHAQEIYASDLSAAVDNLHDDDRPSTFEDTHNNLKESAKATAKAIRELARFTGRAARLAGGKTKKSAGRYCSECGRQLSV